MTTQANRALNRLEECVARYPKLEACRADIESAFYKLKESYTEGGQMLLCGNGGSAADADHISGELLKGFGHPRPITGQWREKLGNELANNLQGALPAIPLTVFPALKTAYGNDCNADYTFAQLTWALGRPGDTLFCISTSGNSRNVVLATDVAKAKGMITIALTGEHGGKLRNCVDVCIRVPETEVYKIQELHLPIYHTLCFMLEDTFFNKD